MHAPLALNSRSGRPVLRIGVLVDTNFLPACQAETLQHIESSNFARLELVVYNGSARPKVEHRRPEELLFRWYEQWDGKHAAEGEDPLRPVDCTTRLERV